MKVEEKFNIKQFLDTKKPEEIAKFIAELADTADTSALEILESILLTRSEDPMAKMWIPAFACRALLKKGRNGVDILVRALPEADGASYPKSIMTALWSSSRGSLIDPLFSGVPIPTALEYRISDDTAAAAKEAFAKIIVEVRSNWDLFQTLLNFLSSESMRWARSGSSESHTELVDTLLAGSLRISGGGDR